MKEDIFSDMPGMDLGMGMKSIVEFSILFGQRGFLAYNQLLSNST